MNTPPYYPGTGMSSSGTGTDRFNFDKFLLDQKLFSMNSKYYVYSEQEHPLFFIDRPLMKMKTEITVYEDDSKTRPVLHLKSASMLTVINYSLTMTDANQQVIAVFK